MGRTDSMPEAHGLNKLIRPLRYHEASRQWFAILFVPLVSYFGQPARELLIAGSAVAIIGALIRLWASGHVKKNKVLATDGPYAYVRHPLYVGNILILLGFSIASNLWWAYVLMLFLLLFYYPPAISYEDAKLNKLFGEEWQNWSRNIHALIPNLSNKAGTTSSDWSFKQSLFKNGEPVIMLYLIGCMYLLIIKL
ncbi:MAG: isoprenylcysteine carboxylmethyltransferase family protein [Gammaproteobacteria bacterium]|jgi:protein-S-isoprenylcysteine O-methyltransferase Ste14